MALFKRKNKEDGQKFKSLLNTPRLVGNGVFVCSKGTKVDMLSANGLTVQLDFEIENTKLFPACKK